MNLLPRQARLSLVGTHDDPRIFCNLDAEEVGERIAEWTALAARATARWPIADGVRLLFDRSVGLAEVAGLVERESGCCAFLAFAIEVDRDNLGLEIRVPSGPREIVDELLGG